MFTNFYELLLQLQLLFLLLLMLLLLVADTGEAVVDLIGCCVPGGRPIIHARLSFVFGVVLFYFLPHYPSACC